MAAVLKEAFSRDKTVDAPVLNRLGLQAGRTVASTAIVRLHRWSTPPDVAAPLAALRRHGFAFLPDLFSSAELDEITAVAQRVNEAPDIDHFALPMGGNRQEMTWRSDIPRPDREVLDRFWTHPQVLSLFAAAERLEVVPGGGRCTIQHLIQGSDGPDREAEIHSDTFHPTHKMWLYLTDVTEDDGPLVYYPGSQRITPRLLRGVYAGSVSGDRASRAISDQEIADRKLEPKVFTCPRGTVVIANTFGYHGRIQGRPPGDRLVLHLEVRPHPFRRPRSVGVDTTSASAAP